MKIVIFDDFPNDVDGIKQYNTDKLDTEGLLQLYKLLEKSGTDCDILGKLSDKIKKHSTGLTVKINTEYRTVQIADIDYVECCQRHIIYHVGSDSFETKETLSKVYDSLKDYGFYQVHYGYIVNFDKVSHFDKYDVILRDGTAVPLSRNRKVEAMNLYHEYIRTHYL